MRMKKTKTHKGAYSVDADEVIGFLPTVASRRVASAKALQPPSFNSLFGPVPDHIFPREKNDTDENIA